MEAMMNGSDSSPMGGGNSFGGMSNPFASSNPFSFLLQNL